MNTATIRTSDPTVRAAQWQRVQEVTQSFLNVQDEVNDLRRTITALKACMAWEWHLGGVDLELNGMLQKRITTRLEALRAATDNILTIQAELEDLNTALNDNYEERANDRD